MVLIFVLGAGLVVGAAVALLARRWPAIAAPKVSGETIATGVVEHPKFADHFRKRFDPKTETGVALIIGTSLVIAAAVGIGIVVAMIRTHAGLAALDLRFANYGAHHASSLSTRLMRDISMLGGTPVVIGLTVVATVIAMIQRPSKALVVFMVLVVAGQSLLSNSIKFLVRRARPDIDRLTGFAGTSFPSGHSTAAAATFAAIALILTRNRSRRVKIVGASIAAGLAAMVASTRVLLGVHWFTDVVAGLLLGWGWFAVCSIAFGGRLLTFGQPAAAASDVAAVTPPADPSDVRSATMAG
jgi:membrane-associated phospholipid phosphatase